MKQFLLLAACYLSLAHSLKSHIDEALEWRDRSIYQVLTDRILSDGRESLCKEDLKKYCGGTFRDVQRILPYVKERLGFDAIYISPFVENTEGGYHGYWAKNFYKVNPHFGTEEDLKQLVQSAHSLNMNVMVDVVFNHVGYVPEGNDFSDIVPFNKPDHFHDRCDIQQSDWDTNNRPNIERCRLCGLPDLNTESEDVKRVLFDWIRDDVIHKYGFDAIRIDTVRHINMRFWQELTQVILSDIPVFTLGEVMNGDINIVSEYQTSGGLDGLMNYPLYYQLVNTFVTGKQSVATLKDFHISEKISFKDLSMIGNFLDNHDVNRVMNQLSGRFKDKSEQRSVLLNMLCYIYLTQGIPILYYGTEALYSGGNDPQNRETFDPSIANLDNPVVHYIKTLNDLRREKHLPDLSIEYRHTEGRFLTMSRGREIYAILSNNQDEIVHETKVVTNHPYEEGDVLCNAFHEHDCVTIDEGKRMIIKLIQGYPKIYIPFLEI
ncbi:hypothetical protein FGO68_gene5734 [Halteria grandinella]|uniref:alpha-amylase n=1 Tax=Halteria grandinella TaxID=5974 RepID=A0A8J8NQM0_HALGN|nr:hypothetical protein FGO68_gene5734 [Halteria grandinella]